MARHLDLAPDLAHLAARRRSGRSSGRCPCTSCRTCSSRPRSRRPRPRRRLSSEASGEGQVVLGLEPVVAGGAVLRDADHRDAGRLELGIGLGEALGLLGAARRVVLGIEVQHQRPALEIGQPRPAAARGRAGRTRAPVVPPLPSSLGLLHRVDRPASRASTAAGRITRRDLIALVRGRRAERCEDRADPRLASISVCSSSAKSCRLCRQRARVVAGGAHQRLAQAGRRPCRRRKRSCTARRRTACSRW